MTSAIITTPSLLEAKPYDSQDLFVPLLSEDIETVKDSAHVNYEVDKLIDHFVNQEIAFNELAEILDKITFSSIHLQL